MTDTKVSMKLSSLMCCNKNKKYEKKNFFCFNEIVITDVLQQQFNTKK